MDGAERRTLGGVIHEKEYRIGSYCDCGHGA